MNSSIDNSGQVNKERIKEQYKKIINIAKHFISNTAFHRGKSTTFEASQDYIMKAINTYNRLLECLEITDYLLIDANPIVPKDVYIESYFMLGTLYKTYVEAELQNDIDSLRQNELNRQRQVTGLTQSQHDMYRQAISCFINILHVKFEDSLAVKQIVSIYTHMCFVSQSNLQICLQYLQESLLYAPENETIHYNLGIVYQKINKLELSIIHYKLSLQLSEVVKTGGFTEELRQLTLNNYNGIASIYRSIKQWPEALYYLKKAETVDDKDPDIQNQLGVVYTEMRRTDLAELAYKKALKNVNRCFISTDSVFLKAETYLNFGHMHSYNGENEKAIESYNQALKICPKFSLPFQNKLMNLSYIFDQLNDKMYILNQHKHINKLYPKGNGRYVFNTSFFDNPNKINIGIISGDFTDHPVSFFISTFLKNFDKAKFNVTCYSECIIDTGLYSDNLKFTLIKNMTSDQAANLIHSDKVHILFDLAGHTAFNRLDIFALKPSPIQVTYIGYPYSTGLTEMDYRITDSICDKIEVSQKFYTEQLKMLDNCFLCYDPTVIKRDSKGKPVSFEIPTLGPQPMLAQNSVLRIGCFNRVNKITDSVIKEINKIMLHFGTVHFVFKTKALINKDIQKQFLNKFDKSVRERITILDCTISHEAHLLEYNKVDIAFDTFPYSGTTTSCEALLMGVPVFTLWDKEWWMHCQNVTSSILKNSNLDFYVCESTDEIIDKIQILINKPSEFWKTLKEDTRKQFLSGKVCDKKTYMTNIELLLTKLFNEYKVSH